MTEPTPHWPTRKRRILLLNPAAPVPYVRDNYCSYSAKAADLWAPTDLVYQSGHLAQDHEVAVLDALAEGLRPGQCVRRVVDLRPDAILFVTGEACWVGDLRQVAAIRARLPGIAIAATGDFALGAARPFLEQVPDVDAVLSDFFSDGLAAYLRARRTGALGAPIDNVAYRLGPRLIVGPRRSSRIARVPRPLQHLFPHHRYRFSVGGGRRAAVVLSSIGCAHGCPFCSGSLMRLQVRPADDVLEELTDLAALGVEFIHFFDADFTSSPQRVRVMAEAIRARLPGLAWSCNAHVSALDESTVAVLAASGCETVMLGLESGNDETLVRLRKGVTTADARRAVARCRAAGIGVLGYLMIGLPEEDRAQMRRTIDFAVGLDLEYASFNLPCPIPGTLMYARYGRPAAPGATLDHSIESGVRHPRLSEWQVRHLRREAYRRFYLRPRYLWRRLAGAVERRRLAPVLRAGWAVLRHGL